MNRYCLSFCLLLLHSAAFSQNLVPNPGFEDTSGIKIINPINTIRLAKHWNGYSADYYHADRQPEARAHNGKVCAGLLLYTPDPDNREFIYVRLSEPLKAGIYYTFEAYLRLFNAREATDGFGVMVADTIIHLLHTLTGSGFRHPKDSLLGDPKDQYVPVRGTFKAKGGEKYLVIGTFDAYAPFRLKEFQHEHPKSTNNVFSGSSYYLLDDVSLTADSPFHMGESFTMDAIGFETNSATLLPSAFEPLEALADFLTIYPQTHLYLTGHTDNTGDEELNLRLSTDRALSIAQYLAGKGIDAARLHAGGKGSREPISTNDTEAGRQMNRRVMFLIR